MSDTEAPRTARRNDDAVADSTPDFNVLIANAGRSMLKPLAPFVGPDGKVHKFTLLNLSRMTSAMWVITLLIFFVTALPSLVGATLLFDKMGEERSRARGFQLEMFKLQTDLEIAKLDRTMLGEGAMKTLQSIVSKVETIGKKQDDSAAWQIEVSAKVEGLVSNVGKLTSRQNSLAAQQAATQAEIKRQAQQPPVSKP